MVKLPRKNWLLLNIFLFLLSGCGYHILNLKNKKEVYISHFKNLTLQPQLDIYIIENLKEKIMDYPLFNLAKDKETADIVINGTIRNLWREPAFFSSTDGKDIVMGKLWVEVEVEIDENGKSWSEKIRENIGVPLAEKYEEEKVLEKIGEEIAGKIYFLLLKNEKGK